MPLVVVWAARPALRKVYERAACTTKSHGVRGEHRAAAVDRQRDAGHEIVVEEKQHTLGDVFRCALLGLTSVALIERWRSSCGRSGGMNTGPGRMQLTRTFGLRLPNSTAKVRVSVGMAPLDVKYAA